MAGNPGQSRNNNGNNGGKRQQQAAAMPAATARARTKQREFSSRQQRRHCAPRCSLTTSLAGTAGWRPAGFDGIGCRVTDLSTIRFTFRDWTRRLRSWATACILFGEEQQQLNRFNDSSAALALRLARRVRPSPSLTASIAVERDVDATAANEGWVADFLHQLAGPGPAGRRLAASSRPSMPSSQTYAIAGVALGVDFETDALLQSIAPPLAHLRWRIRRPRSLPSASAPRVISC